MSKIAPAATTKRASGRPSIPASRPHTAVGQDHVTLAPAGLAVRLAAHGRGSGPRRRLLPAVRPVGGVGAIAASTLREICGTIPLTQVMTYALAAWHPLRKCRSLNISPTRAVAGFTAVREYAIMQQGQLACDVERIAQDHQLPVLAVRRLRSLHMRDGARCLFDPRHHLAGHPGESVNLSFQSHRLGAEASMLQRIRVSSTSFV